MQNQINKNNISFIELCPRTDTLPAIQYIAMKHKVCLRFEHLLNKYLYIENKASYKFATYVTFLETPPELFGNVADILSENFVPADVVEECLMYIRSGIVPYHIWTDKLLSDMKETFLYKKESLSGMVTIYLGKALKASLIAFNKAVNALEENEHTLSDDVKLGISVIKSRFREIPHEMKENYLKMYYTDDEVERRKFQDNEMSIFSETLINTLDYGFDDEVLKEMYEGKTNIFKDFWLSFGMSGGVATYNSPSDDQLVTSVNTISGGTSSTMGCWWTLLGYGPNGETPEEYERLLRLREHSEEMDDKILLGLIDETENNSTKDEISTPQKTDQVPITNAKNLKYAVKKVTKDASHRVMSINWFNSKSEAEDFIDEVINSNPALGVSFDFQIESSIRE